MIGKLMLAFSAILLTTVLGLAIGQQKPEPKATPENSEQKAMKVKTGEVASIDATKSEITIKDEAGMQTRLLVDSSTKITSAGQSIAFADLKVGDKISSDCAESSDACKAKAIQVIPPAPKPA